VICDELAWWTTPNLKRAYAALTSGGGARSAPQTFTITTAGEASSRHDGILGTILDAGLDCDDVTRTAGLTICKMHAARTLIWEYRAPTDDPHDTKAMKLANPASWISESYLRRQADDPELTDAQVLQLHGCVWAASSSTWIGPEAWAARADLERVIEPGSRIVIGFDGSARRDSTVFVACTLDGFVAPVQVWERPERAPADWKVPREEVGDVLERMISGYDVAEVACDPYGWHSEIEQWSERYGTLVVEFPTATREKMAAACGRFRAAVLDGTLTHDGSDVLRRHIDHCVAKVTPYGTVITKSHPDSPRKIDCAVAAVIAHERACWHAAHDHQGPLVAWA
jgi:phage terminase large subunit-like protein